MITKPVSKDRRRYPRVPVNDPLLSQRAVEPGKESSEISILEGGGAEELSIESHESTRNESNIISRL